MRPRRGSSNTGGDNSFDPIAYDDRGAVMVEYVVLLCVVAVGCALATMALGGPLMRMFLAHQTWLTLPFP